MRTFSYTWSLRSRDKDGGHTIRSAIAKKHETSWFHVLDRSYCRWKSYIAGIGIFDLFCSCDLDLDPMTFIYELGPYSLDIYHMCKYELSISKLSKVIIRQTDRQT